MSLVGKVKTESQRVAFNRLKDYATLFFSDRTGLEVYFECLVHPLIAGPSGTGKSFLVRELANFFGCPLFRVTFGEWKVSGCRVGESTVTQIGGFVQTNPRGIIHLDELDKVGKPQGGSDWTRAANVELYNLIDGRPTATDDSLEEANWDESLQQKYRDSFFIVGTATFQSFFEERPNPGYIQSLGAAANWLPRFQKRLRQQDEISVELLERFNNDVILLPPLTRTEAQEILELMQASQPTFLTLAGVTVEELADQAVASGSNIRFFEELVTNMALRALAQKRNEPAFLPIPGKLAP